MTNECCIPNCKNTLKSNPEKYTLFWVPKDNHQRKKWENILPRKGPLKQTHRVCALHFQDHDIIKASIFDGISQRSPRSYASPQQQKSPHTPASTGRRSTRSMTDEDFASNRAKVYSYDFESDRASEMCDDIELDHSSSSSDYSDWTVESSERMWTPIPAKRARIRISNPVTLNSGLYLPAEALRPSDLLTPVHSRITPFQPQMGDEVIYFRQGHELYVDAVNQQKHSDLHLRSLPWLNEQELVKIIGIKYDIKPPNRLFCLKLRLTPDTDSSLETKSGVLNGGSFTVKYHNVDGVPDFLVLKHFYDWAIRRDWQPGERFRSYRNDSWREGQIEMREPFSTHCPNSLFLCYRIRWENGEMERLSPWDLHETTKKPRGRPRSVNKVNMPGSIDCPDSASYKPQIVDWPPVGDMDFECDRISSGISKIMNLTAAKPFTAPVNLEAYPLYVFVVKYPPMDLSTVKSRLDNRFYRRLAAVQYDVRTICSNAYKFNEPKSDIVRNASIISDLCLEVIRNRDSTDAITSVYQQLVEKYKSQNDEVILENPVTSVAKECDQPAPTPRSASRLNSPHSQPAEEINGIVTSKSKEKKISTPRPYGNATPISNERSQSTAPLTATAGMDCANKSDNTVAIYPKNSCVCAIDVLLEDKVQYLNEKEQLDVDIENRFRTLVTTIESELVKERNLLSEQKQKIAALRVAMSQQTRDETCRPADSQWPEILKLTRLAEEREKVHSPLVLVENKKLTQEMAFLEQQIVVKKLQVELNLMDAKENPQQFRAIEKKLEESKLQAKQMENNLKPISDELLSLKQREKDLDRQISELKANFNNLLATMEVIATSIQNQISNMDTKKRDIICNLKERIHASKMLEMKLIKIAYQEAISDSHKKAEERLNKLDRLAESDPLELNDAMG
ncbi:bromodomain and WD repeat-containing protein 3-like isoform X2 [Daphnia pulicaria]|uniref:bromodomain and WD repeat-containing protein 3-like isoform X2 n=1 Tax=Daphnia pulicaria TaxID=35523 RepID=UPI001EEB49DE|nr:bromodomain and WD repeat-containing protein 3-like isoform X2 [Daphnia pulicaria]